MKRRRKPRVGLVIKRTAYDLAFEQPDDPLLALLERGDPTVRSVMGAHEEHTSTVAEVREALAEAGVEVQRVRRRREDFADDDIDLLITVGGDGTLLHASHGIGATPVLAINSCPSFSVGFFCGARKGGVAKALGAALRGKLARASLTRMQVQLNGEVVHQRVLNDCLFCHRSPAATSRYILEYDELGEEQKSSGFWIGPAAGSTAAQRSAGGRVLPLSSRNLQCVVRESYTPSGEATQLARVLVKPNHPLYVRSKSSKMRIYLDGPDEVLKVNRGDVVEFTQSPEPLELLGISVRRKWGERA